MKKHKPYSRRHVVAGLAVAPIGLAAGLAPAKAQTATGVCVLTPQATEGPFYFDPRLERADITEGRTGVPLKLQLQVIDAASCKPLSGARVDVWHCDAVGFYSGYDGQGDGEEVSTRGQDFLRGTQFADAAGNVKFDTIYPGWYRGRTAHIHFKVFLDRRSVLTGQLYFPEEVNEFIYANAAPYNARGAKRDTMNADDGILSRSGAGSASISKVTKDKDFYVASLVIGAGLPASIVTQGHPVELFPLSTVR